MICLLGNPSVVVVTLSIPGTEERTSSNIYRGANIIDRFQGKRIFSVYCGMQHS